MEQVQQAIAQPVAKRRLERVDEGIFRYCEKGGTERYAVRLKHREKEWRKFGFPTISKARQWRDSRRGALVDGRLFPEHELAEQQRVKEAELAAAERETAEQAKGPLLKDYAAVWFAACKAKLLKHSTLLRYGGILREHLLPTFGEYRLADITRERVRQFVHSMVAANLTPKTIHNVLAALSSLFAQANEDGLAPHNPALKPSKLVRRPRKDEHVDVFTHEEEVLVLNKAQEVCPHYYPFTLCLFRTGLREGEAIALTPDDLDLAKRYVGIERNFTAGRLEDSPKNGKRRQVDLAPDLVEMLKNHVAVQEAEAALTGQPRSRWLFPTLRGEIIRSNNFRDRVWRPLLKKAGLRYRNVHSTRHTYATRMILGGANLVYVSRQLGHSSIQITVDLYTHWIERSERGHTLDVDRLQVPPFQLEGVTFGGPVQAGKV